VGDCTYNNVIKLIKNMNKPDFKKITKKDNDSFTNIELYKFYETLQSIPVLKNIKLWNAVNLTISSLEPIYKELKDEKLIPKSEMIKEFDTKIAEMYKELSGGKTKTVELSGGKTMESWDIDFDNPDIRIKIEETMKELEEVYKDDLNTRKSDIKEYDNFMLEPFTEKLTLYKVSIADLKDGDIPEDIIQAKALHKLVK
jgi:hypothetical protein